MRLTDSRGIWTRVLSRRGGALAICRLLLTPAGFLYGLAARARRRAYRIGILQARSLDAPVISVGNLTVGGTGKTPMVLHIARWCAQNGRKPAILSRGYAARNAGLRGNRNDEALLLERVSPKIPHYAGPDRVATGRAAIADGADCLVLDDGFQHLRIRRDLNLVLVDAQDPLGGGRVLPAGALRESPSSLRDADAIILTRADAVGRAALETVRRQVRACVREKPIFEAVHRPVGLTLAIGTAAAPAQWLAGRRVFLFCGIGNPEGFLRTVAQLGAEIAAARFLPDHFAYRKSDVAALAEACVSERADCAVTTEKDAVKLGAWPKTVPLRVLKVEIEFTADQAQFEDLLRSALSR